MASNEEIDRIEADIKKLDRTCDDIILKLAKKIEEKRRLEKLLKEMD